MNGIFTVRSARPEDAEAIAVMQSMPAFRAGTLRLPFPSISSVRTWITNAEDEKRILVADQDGVAIGMISFWREQGRRSHVGSLAMGVHDEHAGKGVGSALLKAVIDMADNWLALRRLELTVFWDNDAALALYRKHGFEEEGVLRDFALRDGRYADALAMARIHSNS